MAAFQKDDGPTAYGYASPTIQEEFINPEVFLEMVKTGYPAVYHPRQVEFRDLKVENGRLLQEGLCCRPRRQARSGHLRDATPARRQLAHQWLLAHQRS